MKNNKIKTNKNTTNNTVKAVVISIHPDHCIVDIDNNQRKCYMRPKLGLTSSSIVTGDKMLCTEDNYGTLRIQEILKRENILSRTDPSKKRKELIIAANIDAAVIVCSVSDPPLRLRLIDRYLVITRWVRISLSSPYKYDGF